jgi:hypothetical protein
MPASTPPLARKHPPSPSLALRSTRAPRFAVGRRIEALRAIDGEGGGTPEMRKMRGVTLQKAPRKNIEISNYVTSPPSETAPDLADFHQRQGHAPRFAGKGQGKCTWSMPDGTTRRSFRRTAAGKLAGGWKGETYPPPDKAMTPPQKTKTPLRPPLVFSSYGCRSRASNRAFFALVF